MPEEHSLKSTPSIAEQVIAQTIAEFNQKMSGSCEIVYTEDNLKEVKELQIQLSSNKEKSIIQYDDAGKGDVESEIKRSLVPLIIKPINDPEQRLPQVGRDAAKSENINQRVSDVDGLINREINVAQIHDVDPLLVLRISHLAHYFAVSTDSILQELPVKISGELLSFNRKGLTDSRPPRIEMHTIQNDVLTLELSCDFVLSRTLEGQLGYCGDRVVRAKAILTCDLKNNPQGDFDLTLTHHFLTENIKFDYPRLDESQIFSFESLFNQPPQQQKKIMPEDIVLILQALSFYYDTNGEPHGNIQLNTFVSWGEKYGLKPSADKKEELSFQKDLRDTLQVIAQIYQGSLDKKGICQNVRPDIAEVLEYFWNIPSELVTKDTFSSLQAVLSSENPKDKLAWIKYIHQGSYVNQVIECTFEKESGEYKGLTAKRGQEGALTISYNSETGAADFDELNWVDDRVVAETTPFVGRSAPNLKQAIKTRVEWTKKHIGQNVKNINDSVLVEMSHFIHFFATPIDSDFKVGVQPIRNREEKTITPTAQLRGGLFDRQIKIEVLCQDSQYVTFRLFHEQMIVAAKLGPNYYCGDYILRNSAIVKYPVNGASKQNIIVTRLNEMVPRNIAEYIPTNPDIRRNFPMCSFKDFSFALPTVQKKKLEPPIAPKTISSLTMTILLTQPLLALGLTKIEQIPEVEDLFAGDLGYVFDLAEGLAFLLAAATAGYALSPKNPMSRMFSIGIAVTLAGILQASNPAAEGVGFMIDSELDSSAVAPLAQAVALMCIGLLAFGYSMRQDTAIKTFISQPGFAKTLAIASIALLAGGIGIALMGMEECSTGEWWDAGEAFCESTLGSNILKSSVGAAGGGLLLFKSMSQKTPDQPTPAQAPELKKHKKPK